jgi:hypothetical protein
MPTVHVKYEVSLPAVERHADHPSTGINSPAKDRATAATLPLVVNIA